MGIELVIKIAAIGVIVGILNQVLTKAGKDEYTTATTIAGLILVIIMLLPRLSELFDEVRALFGL